jgi:hypothetical protein
VLGASGCVVTNDMRFSSRTWTDPQSDRRPPQQRPAAAITGRANTNIQL